MCAEADRPHVELARPQLELQGIDVSIVTDARPPGTLRAALAQLPAPGVIAVVVSATFDRHAARAQLEGLAAAVGPGHRVFVLDLRHHPSVVRQVRAVSRVLEGLERALEIEGRHGRLQCSASHGAALSGQCVGSDSNAGTQPLRVVHPPLLLSPALCEACEVVPAEYRVEVPRRRRRGSGNTLETQPEILAPGLSQPYWSGE